VPSQEDLTGETERSDWRTVVIPVLVLLVVVGIVCALVLTEVVAPDQERTAPESIPTTVPTIEVAP
jgi:hypothetical protein